MAQELVATRYELLDRIAQGGVAVVYRARDQRLGRIVALKVLREQYATDAEFRTRFEREARIAAGLAHPNIVGVHDYGAHGDLAFIAMDYVDGGTLKDRLRETGPMPPVDAVRIARSVLAALAYAHARGVIHRDVKPQNVMCDRGGTVKLTDFGIASAAEAVGLTQTGKTVGSVVYMAPEQARGEKVGPPADVYCVGLMLYEMLVGHPPFEGDALVQVMYRQLNDAPVPPSQLGVGLPPALEAALLRSLAKDPAERFASADDMSRALADALAPGASHAAAGPPAETTMPLPPSGPAAETTMPMRRAERTIEMTTPGWPDGPRNVNYVPPARPRRRAPVVPMLAALALLALGALAFWRWSGPTSQAVLDESTVRAAPTATTSPESAPASDRPIVPTSPPAPTATTAPPVSAPTSAPTSTRPAERATATAAPPTATARPTTPPEPTRPAPTATPSGGLLGRLGPATSPTPAPAGQPRPAMGTIALDDSAFRGGFRNPEGVYRGRTAMWVYGTGTQYSTMSARFDIPERPAGGTLVITGLTSENWRPRIAILINDRELFQGDSPFPQDLGAAGDPDLYRGSAPWGERSFTIPPGLLRAGANTLTIRNLEAVDTLNQPPWTMVDAAAVRLGG